MDANYYVYIMASKRNGTLYPGITHDLRKRVWEHKQKVVEGFTKRYNVTTLVYYEWFDDGENALAREKQIKGLLRRKKLSMIEGVNPDWNDLYQKLD